MFAMEPRLEGWNRTWRPALAGPQSSSYEPEHAVHHLRIQLPRIGVLTTRVIAADERDAVGQTVRNAVAESGPRCDGRAALLQQPQIGIKGNPAERDDDARPRERGNFGVEMRQTI